MAGGGAVILDTCALLWLVTGNRKLSRSALKQINEAAAVYVSAISGFEIAIKTSRGRLTLPSPPIEWFAAAVTQHGLTVLPLDLDICITAAGLPHIHDDPCDRFIIASAKLHGCAVVTADERFEKYDVEVTC